MRKSRKPGKTYQVSDIVGGTNLFNSSRTKSSPFHPLRDRRDILCFTRIPRFSCAMLKSREDPGHGYKASKKLTKMIENPSNSCYQLMTGVYEKRRWQERDTTTSIPT